MSGMAQCHVNSLAEAFGVSPGAARAALDRHGGDADAAAEELLTTGAPEHPGGGHTGSGHAAAGGGALGLLMDMGYPRPEAERALAAAGGDMDAAIGRLLDMEGPGSSAAPAASGPAAAAAVDDCAICCEPIRPTDAAMRCTGRGGAHHYGHAKCLASWVQRCRSNSTAPTCPTCREPLQMNPRNLRDFLQQRPSDSSGQSDVLRSMLEQSNDDDDCSDCWQTIDCDRIVLGVAVAAGVIAAGFAAKAIFDAFAKDKRRD